MAQRDQSPWHPGTWRPGIRFPSVQSPGRTVPRTTGRTPLGVREVAARHGRQAEGVDGQAVCRRHRPIVERSIAGPTRGRRIRGVNSAAPPHAASPGRCDQPASAAPLGCLQGGTRQSPPHNGKLSPPHNGKLTVRITIMGLQQEFSLRIKPDATRRRPSHRRAAPARSAAAISSPLYSTSGRTCSLRECSASALPGVDLLNWVLAWR